MVTLMEVLNNSSVVNILMKLDRPINLGGVSIFQEKKLRTSEAIMGPAVKTTKPMSQGERKAYAVNVSRRRSPCLAAG